MKKCVIFSASEISDYSHIEVNGDFIIAADGGLIHTKKLNITPDIVIGDMDSFEGKVPEGALLFPIKKDDTDTMLAIRKGLELGFSEFVIYGGLGGRLDHTVANIQSVAFLKENGANGILEDENHTVFLIENEEISLNKKGSTVSIFSYGEKAKGITLKGFEYPLENAMLDSSFPLGVSNKIIADKATIRVTDGKLLVILLKK